jgi:hypothetical protein
MIIVATDAPLSGIQLERLAKRSLFGLARTGSVMANSSGDSAIAFSTQAASHESIPHNDLTTFFQATVEATEQSVAAITAAAILGRLGDPNRFNSLAGARAFTGLVPILDASGLTGRHGGPTKRGDAVLRQALFMAAGQARRIDPTLAAKYHRLMIEAGKHHNSALCHIATTLLTRIIACWRAGQPYVLRDVDGTAVTIEQARAIIAERYAIPKDLRARRRTTTDTGTDRRNKRSPSAPSTGPSKPNATTTTAA